MRSGEFPLFENNGEEPSVSSHEEFERFLKYSPAMDALLGKLETAKELDKTTVEIEEGRTSRYVMRVVPENRFDFIYDELVLKPKRLAVTESAKKILHFAMPQNSNDQFQATAVRIQDFNELGEQTSEKILTNTTFGWIDDDVSLPVNNDRYLTDVIGVTEEPDFDAEVFIAQLKDYELDDRQHGVNEQAA